MKILSGAFSAGTLVTALFQRYFSEDKFLADVTIKNNTLILTYFNSLTEKDQLAIRDVTIEDVIIKKKKFLLRTLHTISFVSKNNKIKFLVFDKEFELAERTITLFRVNKNRRRNLSSSASLNDIISAIAQKHQNGGISINPPAPISDINEFEIKIGFSLPGDFREFYLTCNGFACNTDIFNMVSLDDIEYGKNWFYFSEYMICSDNWGLRFTEAGNYEIFNGYYPDKVLGSSLKEFLFHFLNGGVFDTSGLYAWQQKLGIK